MANFIFDSARLKMQTGDIDLNTDTFKILLVTSSYTPNQATHDFRDDVTNEVTGTGYTAGGATLASVTAATTAANSWGSTWAASTAYTVGQVRRPTTGNGFLYRAITAGTSAASEPTWPTTKGDTVTDSGTKWANIGASITLFDAADPTWASSSITARAGVVYKSRGGAATADELVAFLDFVSDVTSTAATFTVTLPVEGIAYSYSM
jgi:hypothetical protein